MDKPTHPKKPEPPKREISNANLFADDIIFSDTEKILFEEDLEKTAQRKDLMDGNPADRYTPRKKLNEGGMKAIWEVDDHRTARKVAMALIPDSKIASEQDIDSFLYEARLTANLQHPNIIPIYDIAVDKEGNPYFTMKALKGETLGEIIKKLRSGSEEYRTRYTRTRLLAIFLKVCNAIDYAHTKGVIHLDLKPSNVIVGDFGDVHVLDWGLSTLLTHIDEYKGGPISWQNIDHISLESGQTLTRYLEGSSKQRHVAGGTPGYMSPEQAQGDLSGVDFQTDIYMLGAMLYELLTYECPIVGETVKETLQKTVRGDFLPPDRRAPKLHIPQPLAAIVMKAMKTDPKNRYANVAALIRDIHQFQDGFATTAENPTFFTHAALLVRRHKMAVSLISASLAVITVILAQSFSSIKESEANTQDALKKLQEKSDYIAQTTREAAPDYIELAQHAEREYAFAEAEQKLSTGLTFDESNTDAWTMKTHMLLSQQRFNEAWNVYTQNRPVAHSGPLFELARKYQRTKDGVPDAAFPQLVYDFRLSGMELDLPRLFYHFNQKEIEPVSHFSALAETLEQLNPAVDQLNISWEDAGNGAWNLDISNNAGLDDISPLCGLKIARLTARNIGTPNLAFLTEEGLRSLDLAGTQINYLPAYDPLAEIETLSIRNTRIRNLSNIVKYSKLVALDISGIQGLSLSEQLIWCRNLKRLTLSEIFRDDPIIQSLSRNDTIIIFTEN
ncbi:MAG: protein kinase [Lentisphaerae bacterium]|jgi:serine/threonine protein kinase|nr:protein kinase [Lentisphaerota bacterium]